MRRDVRLSLLALALAVAGCKKPDALPTYGTPVVRAVASDLRLSPDGRQALYLVSAQKPRLPGVPPMMVLGDLNVVSTSGGVARRLARGVTNVPGGYLVSPDSRWAAVLAGYNAATQAGQLELTDLSDPGGQPTVLGADATYMLFSPDSKWLAYVTGGTLKLGSPATRQFRDVAGSVETLHFSDDGRILLFKRTHEANGTLLALTLAEEGPPRKLGDQVVDYAFSPDAKWIAFQARSESVHGAYDLFEAAASDLKSRRVANGTGAFRFSSDNRWLARTEGERPDRLGNLFVGPADGSGGRQVAERVQEFEFSPDGAAIASLEHYDKEGHQGSISVCQLPDGKPVRVGERVPNFIWGADGRFVAFLSRFFKPLYSVDLMLYPVGEEQAFKVHPGVFGYSFGPKNAYLLFRGNCLRNGRSCDLFQVDLAHPKDEPKKIVEDVFSWKPSDDGQRLLVTYARSDSDTYDVSLYDFKKTRRLTIDRYTLPPALFAGPDGAKLVYVVQPPSRAGVYASDTVP